jgi:2-oxoglutarate ferredoxin oxidoreductase subunit delta
MTKPKKQDDMQAPKPTRRSRTKRSERNTVPELKGRFEQVIFRDWCKSCGICAAFCPKKVIGRDDTGAPVIEHPQECIGCRFCELHCPDFAITIKEKAEKGEEGYE